MYTIDITQAKLRHDLPRLRRTSWINTRSLDALYDHLWLYVAWVNGYALFNGKNIFTPAPYFAYDYAEIKKYEDEKE